MSSRRPSLLSFALFLLTSVTLARAQEDESLSLSADWPAERLNEALVPRDEWRPYPPAGDPAWERVPEEARRACIANAEERLGEEWEVLPATLFLEFVRNGNRSRYEAKHFARRERLAEQVLGEVFEAKGRFLDDIANGIWLICEETYWGVPAHVGLQRRGAGLPDVSEPTVDLFAAETAMLLAWTHELLGDRLDSVSELLRPRIAYEVERRVLAPCRERHDFWWMGERGNTVNNWNPWIASNWLTCVLLLEKDSERRAADVARILEVLDRFVGPYPADGGCDEGPGYWTRAAASLFDCLELLYEASDGRIDFFEEPLIAEMGRYVQRMHLGEGWFVNFADCAPRVTVDPALVYRYGHAIDDDGFRAFALAEAKRQGFDGPGSVRSLGRALGALWTLPELEQTRTAAPPLPRDVWLPELQVMVARAEEGSTRGFTLAAKGGHNDESHNHNDVANVIVFHDARPVLVDAGVGTYTRKTFSSERYDIWTMQSGYHNLPAIQGVDQQPGRSYAAGSADLRVSDEGTAFTVRYEDAYPASAGLTLLERTATLDRERDRVTIEDGFTLEPNGEASTWNLLTPRKVERKGDHLILREENAPSIVLSWRAVPSDDPDRAIALELSIDDIPLDDPRLTRSWPDGLRRIRLVWSDTPARGRMRLTLATSLD